MVESETLQFENGRALQNLYANDLKLLQTLEEKLGVKVTTRDGWLRLEGERDNINKARQVFDQLEQARHRGMQIQRHEFQYALDSVSGNQHQPLGQLAGVQLLSSNRRAPISPKTGQQLAYVQAIQSRDLVFGVGPAGTGKTYFAMAMAVGAVTGDYTQIDLPPNKTSGLIEAMRALKKVAEIEFIEFSERDVVRHPLVQSIIHAYRAYREAPRNDPSRLGK